MLIYWLNLPVSSFSSTASSGLNVAGQAACSYQGIDAAYQASGKISVQGTAASESRDIWHATGRLSFRGGFTVLSVSGQLVSNARLVLYGYNTLSPNWLGRGTIHVHGAAKIALRLYSSPVDSTDALAEASLLHGIRPSSIVSTWGLVAPKVSLTINRPTSIDSEEMIGIPNIPITLRMVGHSSQFVVGPIRIKQTTGGLGGINTAESFGIPTLISGSNYHFTASGSISLGGGLANHFYHRGIGSIRLNFQIDPPISRAFNLSDWMYHRPIRIKHTYIDGNMGRFPTLIKITDAHIGQNALPNGNDIRFTGSGGNDVTPLAYELESFEIVDGVAHIVAWVALDYDILNRNETVIYIFYGNPLGFDGQNRAGTWAGGFSLVDHMKAVLIGM